MTEEKEPWPKSMQELTDYIRDLIEKPHDYNTSAEAMSLAAQAAFNYVATEVGATGFQAGWAQLQFIRAQRRLELPFMIVNTDQMIYPQYNVQETVQKFIDESYPAVAKKAKERLAETDGHVHERVKAHWEELSKWYDENVKEAE